MGSRQTSNVPNAGNKEAHPHLAHLEALCGICLVIEHCEAHVEVGVAAAKRVEVGDGVEAEMADAVGLGGRDSPNLHALLVVVYVAHLGWDRDALSVVGACVAEHLQGVRCT